MFMLVAKSMSPTRNPLTGIPSTVFEALQYMLLPNMYIADIQKQFKAYHKKPVYFRLGPTQPLMLGRIHCGFKKDGVIIQKDDEFPKTENIKVVLHDARDVERVLFITEEPHAVYMILSGDWTSTKRFLTADGKLRYIAHGFSLRPIPIPDKCNYY